MTTPSMPWLLPNMTPEHVSSHDGYKALYIDNFAVITEKVEVAEAGIDSLVGTLTSKGIACTLDDPQRWKAVATDEKEVLAV